MANKREGEVTHKHSILVIFDPYDGTASKTVLTSDRYCCGTLSANMVRWHIDNAPKCSWLLLVWDGMTWSGESFLCSPTSPHFKNFLEATDIMFLWGCGRKNTIQTVTAETPGMGRLLCPSASAICCVCDGPITAGRYKHVFGTTLFFWGISETLKPQSAHQTTVWILESKF